MSSCSKTTACLQLTDVYANVKFQKINDSLIAKDTTVPFFKVDYENIRATGKSVSLFKLPINSNADSMQFLLAMDTIGGTDHLLNIKYSKQLHFVSKECGYNYFYTITDLKHNGGLFKKVDLISNNINDNSGQTHLVLSF
jgi:predicted nucleic-acid-binding Zn-ribbon protein